MFHALWCHRRGFPLVIALEAGIYSVLTLSSMRKFSSVSPFSQVTSPTSLTALGRTSRTSWAIIPRHKTLQQVESGKDRSGENPPRPTSERNTNSHRPEGKSWQIDAYPFSAFALIYKHLKQRRNFEPCITIGLSGSAFSLLFLETRCQMLEGVSKYLKISSHRSKGGILSCFCEVFFFWGGGLFY